MGLILPQSIGYWPKRGGGGGAPTARSYIQNGLLVQFDAINNVAYDTPQNPSATVWTDLVGGRTIWSLGRLYWFEDYVRPNYNDFGSYLNKSNSYYGKDLGSNYTIEAVLKEHFYNNGTHHTGACCGILSGAFNTSYYGNFMVFGSVTSDSTHPGENHNVYTLSELRDAKYISVSSDSGVGTIIYDIGGEIDRVSTGNTCPSVSDQLLDFGDGYNSNIKAHAIRIYDRALSVEEMKYNFAIDKVRFGLY